jgi:molybdenum cofactor biosynthesis enzyme MoaA
MPFVVDIPPSSGCKACDRMRKGTEGKAQYCLEHDPAISALQRQKYGVKYKELEKIHEAAGIGKTKRPTTSEFERLFGEPDHGKERV